ncbi:hypothetical protein COP1_031324 [Malus domestica]
MLEISLGSFCRRCRVNVDSAPVFSVFAPLLLTIKLPGKIEAFLGADERLCGTSITVQIVADKVLNARRLVNLLKYHHAWMWTSVSVLLYSQSFMVLQLDAASHQLSMLNDWCISEAHR